MNNKKVKITEAQIQGIVKKCLKEAVDPYEGKTVIDAYRLVKSAYENLQASTTQTGDERMAKMMRYELAQPMNQLKHAMMIMIKFM